MRRWLSLASLVALSACGSDDGGTVSLEDAPEAAARSVCGAYFDCSCADFQTSPWADEGACRDDVELVFQAALNEGQDAGLSYDETWIPLFDDAVRALDCRDVDGALQALPYGDPSLQLIALFDAGKLFFGDVPAGGSCSGSLDLIDGDDCVRGSSCVQGQCVAETEGTGAAGSPCGSAADCERGLDCAIVDDVNTFECVKLPGSGGSCLGVLNLCGGNLACDVGSGRCRSLPGVTEQCLDNNPITPRCEQYAVCGSGGVCQPAPDEGQACDDQCARGLVCEGGSCARNEAFACTVAPQFAI